MGTFRRLWQDWFATKMLVYIRHGATSLNKGGAEERLRGWLPVPLAPKGIEQAKYTAQRLLKVLPVPPTTARESDLNRTMQTGKIIGDTLGVTVTPDPRVRDWNTGSMAGQLVKDVLPQMQHLIKNPDEPAPDGESVNDYRNRFEPLMRELVASPGVHLVVGHARGATLLQGAADPEGGKGGDIPISFLLNRPTVKPGGILIINRNWDTTVDNPPDDTDDTKDKV
jgi:broad specificity phosphatase PhoE